MKKLHPIHHFHFLVGAVASLSLAVMFFALPMLKPPAAEAGLLSGFSLANLLSVFSQYFVPQSCTGSTDPSLSAVDSGIGPVLRIDLNTELAANGGNTADQYWKNLVTCDNSKMPHGGRLMYFSFRRDNPNAHMALRVKADGIWVAWITDVSDAAQAGANAGSWTFGERFISSNVPILFQEKLEIEVLPLKPPGAERYDDGTNEVRVAAYASVEPLMAIEQALRKSQSKVLPMQFLTSFDNNNPANQTPGNNSDYKNNVYKEYVPGARIMRWDGSRFTDVTAANPLPINCVSGCPIPGPPGPQGPPGPPGPQGPPGP